MATEVSISPKTLIDQTVIPGDVVLDLSTMTNQTIKLGSGLHQDNDAISSMRDGKLRYSKPNTYWVESSHKRYIPRLEDHVLGIIVDSKADVGSVLFARFVKTNTGVNPELTCTDESGKAAIFGPLRDGFMFETSTGLSRMLLSSPTCPVLDALGKKISFETAFGLNGRVWVKKQPLLVEIPNNVTRFDILCLVSGERRCSSDSDYRRQCDYEFRNFRWD